MTQFLTQSSPIPPYMAFPRFLLDKDGLNETAKILYTILLDRARLSQKNDGWTDEQGHVFIFFPIKSLAETIYRLYSHISNTSTMELDFSAILQADSVFPEANSASINFVRSI